MATAGYSGTPLVKKLGIKSGARVAFVDAPSDYHETLGPLPEGVTVLQRPGKSMDFMQAFVTDRATLERKFASCKSALSPTGMLWISWPKKSSDMHSDLDGNIVRSVGLKGGLVDVKVCAVDETWSGLKFVRRVKDR